MKITRRQLLAIGPVLLVTVCYVIAAPSRATPDQLASVNDPEFAINDPGPQQSMSHRCDALATSLRAQLLDPWKVIIREPFVLAGDLSEQELDRHYEQTIVPTSHALEVSYFDQLPHYPTTIVICSSDERFRECNVRLDAQERNQYSGLYSRKHRRIIVNIASGDGTLAHELTHALAHADFPTMPEWFDEGLASLHEECEFSEDGLHLIGNPNWRNEVAIEALHRGELRLIEDVTSKRFGSSDRANIDYAHVRSLCLYLQERGMLESYYRTCRINSASDPTGLRSLCKEVGAADPKTFDDTFREWLIASKSERPRS